MRIRAAIKEEHEPLLRSIAVLVAKTGRGLRWPEVMEIASEILHEAVQEALKHADRFDPTRSATAWVRGIAAKLLLSRRRAEARLTAIGSRGRPRRGGLGRRARAALHRIHRRGGRRDGSIWSRHSLASPPKSGGPSNSATTRVWTEKSWQAALGVSTPGAARVRVCRALQALRTHFAPAEEEVFP